MPSVKVAEMTCEELKEMIENTVEQKLLDLLGDPDEGLTVRDEVRQRLIQQQEAVKRGDMGVS